MTKEDIIKYSLTLPNTYEDYPFPDDNTLNKFVELCNGMIYKIVKNLEEIEELKKTRNYLLPLLMNGQDKIKN